MRCVLACLVLGLVSAGAAECALVLNEVCYDPEGPDSGFEWLELHNSGPWAVSLEGMVLESGNGSAPGQWTRVWEGRPGEWCEAGGCFWIGGPHAGRSPDSPGRLDLQNGPDGVRLLREGLELDRLGWGELELSEYYEGFPAAVSGSGRSLARRFDGVDSQDNRTDFEPSAPTPGRPNHPRRDLAVRLYRTGRPLPLPGASGEVEARVLLENRGTEPLERARVSLLVDGRTLLPDARSVADGPAAPAGDDTLPAVPPGGRLEWPVFLSVGPGSGRQSWNCLGSVDGDPVPENDRDTLWLWVGPSAVAFSEICPRPDSAQTEWIELKIADSGGMRLSGWTVVDQGGTEARIDSSAFWAAGSFPVLARDPERLPERGSGSRLAWSGAWPSLNDAAEPGLAADSLFLYDPEWMLVDWAVYGEAPRGSTWVRDALAPVGSGLSAWSARSTPPGGSPGEPNRRVLSLLPEDEALAPRACSLGDADTGLWVRVPANCLPGDWSLRVLDLNGREVYRTGGYSGDRLDHWTRWDASDRSGRRCVPGVYVLRLETRGGNRMPWAHEQALVLGR